MLKSLVLLLSTIFLTSSVYSQKYPFQLGKVDKSQFEIDSCSFYPEAKSMILAEYGDLRIFIIL
ncbi:hypothetical protein QYS48_34390 [Marivirga arenosa]|uniref:Uncharacterized protein n=1 Tax=Marivirga arenosa TaxID=3059076 RepID=A0AA51N7A5_9BACT|nr:hypothetical protein [Marivirga sp. ABR2-2]WMN06955.1 hypothetical protein QYS48_34390 [Marivirga sp. ABR2-2]